MIPEISLEAIESEAPDQLDLIRLATVDVGAFYLNTSGMLRPDFFAQLFDQANRFFHLPAEDKQAVALTDFRGYVQSGAEYTNGAADLKESFEFSKEMDAPQGENRPAYFRLYSRNRWPDAKQLPQFQQTLHEFSEVIDRLARKVLRCWALSLGQPADSTSAQEGLFAGDLCSFSRLIYYSDPQGFNGQIPRLSAHTDHGLFTMTLQNAEGLEVQTTAGQWVTVGNRDDCVLVFPGELMEFWTRGYFKPLPHRVLNQALRTDRISIATFLLPDLRNKVSPIDPASSPQLAKAKLGVSRSNVWLAPFAGENAVNEEELLCQIVVGEKEWERINVIFPAEQSQDREESL